MRIDQIERIYVINLARREDRWETIQDEWRKTKVDIPLTRFIACDGREFIPPKSWDVGGGAYGCYLSHLLCLTDIVRLGLDNVLVFEDDACFIEGFREKLEKVLSDLPPIYDALYLGWQALHVDRVPPARITENLGRAGNNNRTHATMYSNQGAKRLLSHFQDLGERHKKDHIDHWAGRLHEQLDRYGEHVYDIYNAIPQLVYQSAGSSDICGKETPLHTWAYRGPWKEEKPKVVTVRQYKTGYGEMGKNGQLGYEKKTVTLEDGAYLTTLSLHAPSAVSIVLSEPLFVAGFMNGTGGSGEPVTVIIDGTEVGQIQEPKSMTTPIKLGAGEHKLEFKVDEKHKGMAHTVWVFSRVK